MGIITGGELGDEPWLKVGLNTDVSLWMGLSRMTPSRIRKLDSSEEEVRAREGSKGELGSGRPKGRKRMSMGSGAEDSDPLSEVTG